jgi:LmbE family N-acetylglucosaminyl deacetylase
MSSHADRTGAGPLKVLAVGAHPDDIELGCGGSLAKLGAAGATVEAVVFSQGRRGALNDADRAAETETALRAIGIDLITIYDFEDTQLWRHVTDMIGALDRHIEALAPHRVYTMFQHDRHQDHRAVYEASAIACRRVPQFFGYETPSSYPNFAPTVFEDIQGQLETKVTALRCHASQGDRLYMQEEKIRSAAHFRGVQVDVGPSEGFIPYKVML